MNVQSEEDPVSWSTADIPDLSGRSAVVTGANGGLGLETARAPARAGADVVMAARNQDKAAEAVSDIRAAQPDAKLEVIPLDLGSQASVKQACGRIAELHPALDLLINNAGVMGIPERKTADGYEMQFGTNHLGHWTLTALLMPTLLRPPAARIVTVTSTAHHMGRAVNPKNPHLRGNYGAWKAYGQSKLANFHFGMGLHRMLKQAGVPAASLIAHPGLSNTDLQAVSVQETEGGFSQRFFHNAAKSTGMSPAEGALPQLRAATDPQAKSGEFYVPMWVNSGPPVRKPILRRLGASRAIKRLWEVSERETGVPMVIAAPAEPVAA
jgi:NAD(P)-dependent dehydrogenase (short-subunit alcohol dehydrogenase family)